MLYSCNNVAHNFYDTLHNFVAGNLPLLNQLSIFRCVLDEELQSLFNFDPLLVITVMYICPLSDISSLCAILCLPYAIKLVTKKTEGISSFGGSKQVCVFTHSVYYCVCMHNR